jgi:U5 small nuclear ribonucleoprotein component
MDGGEEDLYDEFGNYIGPDLDSGDDSEEGQVDDVDEEEDEDDDEEDEEDGPVVDGDASMVDGEDDTRIVQHEDKKYYPTAMEVYGEEVETTVQEEDTQPITQPIVAPVKAKDFDHIEKKIPQTVYSDDFLLSLLPHTHLVRNVAVVGHMQHGKTTLVDNLVGATHIFDEARKRRDSRNGEGERYTDSRVDEQKRGLSIKASPLTMLLQTPSSKHYVFNIADTPGHTNFADEVTASLRLADGVLLVVGAVEGVLSTTERLIRHVVDEKLPIVLLVNKLDRLMLELKLPPQDAYFKLKQVVDEVNGAIHAASGGVHRRLSPDEGNVVFASATQNWYAAQQPATATDNAFDSLFRLLCPVGSLHCRPRASYAPQSPPSSSSPRPSCLSQVLHTALLRGHLRRLLPIHSRRSLREAVVGRCLLPAEHTQLQAHAA